MAEQDERSKRNQYKKINEEIREELIERVVNQGEQIKEVAGEMNVNISTCKAILKVYQEEGRIGKKKKRNKVLNVVESYSYFSVDGSTISKVGDTQIESAKISVKRNQNIDQLLEKNTKEKAEKRLDEAIHTQNKQDQRAQLQTPIFHYNQFQTMQPQLFPTQSDYSSQALGFPNYLLPAFNMFNARTSFDPSNHVQLDVTEIQNQANKPIDENQADQFNDD